jgi:hypothetical protein
MIIEKNKIYRNDIGNLLIQINSILYEDEECFGVRLNLFTLSGMLVEVDKTYKLLKCRINDWREVFDEM